MQKYAAELFGTFVLVFAGCGTAVLAGNALDNTGIALAFGIAVMAMVYAIGHISGCHINPAISVAMFVNGRMSGKDMVAYIVFQCVGAIIAAGVLLAVANNMAGYDIADDGLGENGWGEGYGNEVEMPGAFVAEVVLTMIFLIVIFGATSERAPVGFAGIAIGLSLTMIHLVSIPVTGTSVNPARSLGPAIFVGGDAIAQLWLFWVAPIVGAVIAALVWRFVLEDNGVEDSSSD
ncbi:MAG: aquaporin Z [Thermoplasmata archaeon]|nr:MAG: aquaporin Z [Thermoplasmata archaeon]